MVNDILTNLKKVSLHVGGMSSNAETTFLQAVIEVLFPEVNATKDRNALLQTK